MSVFRPARRARSPDGREWEIYVFRLKLRERGPQRDAWLESEDDPRLQALGGIVWLLRSVVRLLARLLVDLPLGAARSLRTDEWTVEAVSWSPYRRSYTWSTSGEFRGHVVAQVEGGLSRGDVPRPRNAIYLGADL